MTGLTDEEASRANSRLWEERARGCAEVQEGEVAPACHAVPKYASGGQGTSHFDLGCGAGAAVSASLGASVAGLDASVALLQFAHACSVRKFSGW